MLDWMGFKDWLFLALLGGAGSLALAILWSISRSIKTLNQRVAEILTDSAWYKKTLDRLQDLRDEDRQVMVDHESRISKLEAH